MEQINSTRSFQTCAFYNFMDRSSFLMIQNSTVGCSIPYSAQRYPNPIPNLFIVTAIARRSVSKDFDKLYFWFPSGSLSVSVNIISSQSVTSRSREFVILFDGIGTGMGKIWYRKKSRNRSRKNLVPKKSRNRPRKKIGNEKVSELVTEIFGLSLETFRSEDFPT